jgi:hypothetical protein
LSFSGWWAGGSAGAVVAAGGVEGEVAEEFAGGGVDDADVDVGDEQDDAGSGVGAANTDVVQVAVVAQGDRAAVGDTVVADTEVGVVVAVAGAGFGSGGVGDGGGGPLRERSVRSAGVVDLDEVVEECLEFADGGGLGGVGRPATPSSFVGTVRLCRRWSGGWVSSSSGRCPCGAVRSRRRCGRRCRPIGGW